MQKEQITIESNTEKDKKRRQGNKKLNIYGTILVIIECIVFIFPFTQTAEILNIQRNFFWIIAHCVTIPLYILYIIKSIKHFKQFYIND